MDDNEIVRDAIARVLRGDGHVVLETTSVAEAMDVAEEVDSDAFGNNLAERAYHDQPKVYQVRFPDGLEGDVFEDELSITRDVWDRPDPPPPPDGIDVRQNLTPKEETNELDISATTARSGG